MYMLRSYAVCCYTTVQGARCYVCMYVCMQYVVYTYMMIVVCRTWYSHNKYLLCMSDSITLYINKIYIHIATGSTQYNSSHNTYIYTYNICMNLRNYDTFFTSRRGYLVMHQPSLHATYDTCIGSYCRWRQMTPYLQNIHHR